jgi:hypothetical protein
VTIFCPVCHRETSVTNRGAVRRHLRAQGLKPKQHCPQSGEILGVAADTARKGRTR